MRALIAAVVCTCCWSAAGQQPPPAPAEEESRTVTVTAEGYTRDDALKQALRRALEQGAGVQIAAYSEVENFALARDTIYSRAAGVISDYRVLSERETDAGTWEVSLRAVVRRSAVAAAWGEVQNVLDQIGRPKIMVWIDESIDGQLQKQSLVESRIEELLVKAGFDLVAREGAADIRRRDVEGHTGGQRTAEQAQLAREAGAHILIRGYANAHRAGLENLYGTPAAFYNCDVQAKVYTTDTAKLLASESIPVTRRGVRSRREFSPQAARAALVAATFPSSDTRREPALAIRLFETVMEQWSTQISAGSTIELEVGNLDFKRFLTIKSTMAAMQGVQSVNGEFTDSVGKFRVQTTVSAATLAELLTHPPFDGWLDITDLKLQRIRARSLAKPE